MRPPEGEDELPVSLLGDRTGEEPGEISATLDDSRRV